jgi:hypothetical protein
MLAEISKPGMSSAMLGEVPLEPWGDIEIYIWDGQTLCPRIDCFKLVAAF